MGNVLSYGSQERITPISALIQGKSRLARIIHLGSMCRKMVNKIERRGNMRMFMLGAGETLMLLGQGMREIGEIS
jgi:hypothetical protein